MRRRERAQKILEILDDYFPNVEGFLHHDDPYTLLVAVLLSAQCTDERVNQVTPHLFALAKTPQEMMKLSVEQIEKVIKSCGLYRNKAKAIRALSAMLCEQFDGEVPNTLVELESLPGVGHKTASVVLSQAFHMPAFPVDTHIHRCAKRWKLSKATNVQETENDLKKLFPESLWGRIHVQIIAFARAYCPARGHSAEVCPICSWV